VKNNQFLFSNYTEFEHYYVREILGFYEEISSLFQKEKFEDEKKGKKKGRPNVFYNN